MECYTSHNEFSVQSIIFYWQSEKKHYFQTIFFFICTCVGMLMLKFVTYPVELKLDPKWTQTRGSTTGDPKQNRIFDIWKKNHTLVSKSRDWIQNEAVDIFNKLCLHCVLSATYHLELLSTKAERRCAACNVIPINTKERRS